MPNINITDSRKRDAVVKAENTGVQEEVRYIDSEGSVASTRKVLKATVAHDFDTLNKRFGGDPQKLGYALIEGDPEVDMERCGVYLWGVSKVYVTSDDGIVYRIEQTEKVLDTNGEVKETRPRRHAEANVDAEIPLTWTGRKINKADAIKRFVFSSKLQVVHVNGLTYDFLYGMAKELDSERSLMMVGGGSAGKDPLVFRRGSVPYRGFLEGRIDGEQYILLLHLSNMELKVPESGKDGAKSKDAADKDAAKKLEPGYADKAGAEKAGAEKAGAEKAGNEIADAAKQEVKKAGAKKAAAKKSSTKKTAARKSPKETKTDDDAVEENADPDSQEKKKTTTVKASADDSKAAIDAESVDTDSVSTDNSDRDAGVGSEVSALSTMQEVNTDDLGVWLKSIRMGKYLDLFVANEIDVDVLTELTDDDLKELEIPLGSRRRLLKAVEEADNLRAEVAMAVRKISRSSADAKSTSEKKKAKKKKSTTKKADRRSK